MKILNSLFLTRSQLFTLDNFMTHAGFPPTQFLQLVTYTVLAR